MGQQHLGPHVVVGYGIKIFWPVLFITSPDHLVVTYGLLTKCEVKMAGYWLSSLFACLWTEMESRSINSQKKNEANIQPS